MLSNKKYIVLLVIIVIAAFNSDLFAQIELPGDGDVDDVPPAPIHGFIAIAAVIGSYIGYRKLKK